MATDSVFQQPYTIGECSRCAQLTWVRRTSPPSVAADVYCSGHYHEFLSTKAQLYRAVYPTVEQFYKRLRGHFYDDQPYRNDLVDAIVAAYDDDPPQAHAATPMLVELDIFSPRSPYFVGDTIPTEWTASQQDSVAALNAALAEKIQQDEVNLLLYGDARGPSRDRVVYCRWDEALGVYRVETPIILKQGESVRFAYVGGPAQGTFGASTLVTPPPPPAHVCDTCGVPVPVWHSRCTRCYEKTRYDDLSKALELIEEASCDDLDAVIPHRLLKTLLQVVEEAAGEAEIDDDDSATPAPADATPEEAHAISPEEANTARPEEAHTPVFGTSVLRAIFDHYLRQNA